MLALAVAFTLHAHAADQWTAPTPEELKMTSIPEMPGASAVVLMHEELMDDTLHSWSFYQRVKILNDAGKKYADVELPYVHYSDGGGYTITGVSGRTIHADGSIVPFSGKPFDKLISKEGDERRSAKVFTMPDVQAGSIIEFRYQLRYDDNLFIEPRWSLQSELFQRKTHFYWKATNRELMTENGRIANGISWAAILPKGVQVTRTQVPAGAGAGQHADMLNAFDVKMQDVPALPKDSYLPPLTNFDYHVYFYYAAYNSAEEFWKVEGKNWSKRRDKFIGPDTIISTTVQKLVSPADVADVKLKKIYAFVQTIENTDFTRQHSAQEERAQGDAPASSAADVLQRKRGTSDQISDLFVAMARAAGLKAYAMAVVNREHKAFDPTYLSLDQFEDNIAIINVGGKDQFFDPGSRYCAYGHLAWQHSSVTGLRQTDDGTSISQGTPAEPYTASVTKRIADLTLAQDSTISGSITLVYTGAPALEWRQRALATDDAGIHESLKRSLERMLPNGMDVHVDDIDKLADYESPLKVTYTVKGSLGSATGKRLILPGDLFVASSEPIFTSDKREFPVYFHYAYYDQDAERIKFPAGFTLESSPKPAQSQYQKSAIYQYMVDNTPNTNSITTHRNFAMADIIIPQTEYPQLKTYYSQMAQQDQETVVLLLPGAGGK